MSRHVLVLGIFVLLLALFPSTVQVVFAQDATPMATASEASPAETDAVEGTSLRFSVSVGDRSLHVACEGSGSPTVVQEIGGPDPEGGVSAIEGGGTIVSGWLGGLRFCGYDRAGTGGSAADPAGIRSLKAAGADLLAVLAAPELECPCVVMGESLGGGIALAALAVDPTNFAGLVLADSLLPGFAETVLELAPAGSPEAEMDAFFAGENEEMLSYEMTPEMVPANAPETPVNVVTHGQGFPPPCPCSAGFPAEQLEAVWQEGQANLADQLGAGFIVAENAGHVIAVDDPDLLIEAILQVIAESESATPVAN